MRNIVVALVALCLLTGTFFIGTATGAGIEDIERITPRELMRKLDRGEQVLIIDVRSSGAYAASTVRLPGDVRIAPDEIIGRVGEIPMGAEIVTYCT
ncbi:MAG: hypothetical protein IME99_03865 [Proteobacteria bacterium]|nr:hypothetical protein [Pseudomonadota bacterium]